MTNRLKVLILASWYPSREHPTRAVFVREHAKAVSLFDDVRVLCAPDPKPNLKHLWQLELETDSAVSEQISTYRLSYRHLRFFKLSYFTYLWSILRAYQTIVRTGFRPDVIHAHVYELGIPAVILGKIFRTPVVITEHFSEFLWKVIRGKELWKAKLAFGMANRVITVSHALQQAIEAYGIKAEFRVIPNPVASEFFHMISDHRNNTSTFHLLFVGGLERHHKKGVPFLLRALSQLATHRRDWHMDIIGDGETRREYESLKAELGLTDFVSFHGNKPRAEVVKFMHRANLFVLPSLWETFSVVTAEALASGTPVIVTRCGGPEEFVTPEVGTVVPKGDSEALANALRLALDHLPAFNHQKLTEYARSRFSPEVVGKMTHDMYMGILSPDEY
jgi:glycosyltransferase involved in cell wall biosynthesis